MSIINRLRCTSEHDQTREDAADMLEFLLDGFGSFTDRGGNKRWRYHGDDWDTRGETAEEAIYAAMRATKK